MLFLSCCFARANHRCQCLQTSCGSFLYPLFLLFVRIIFLFILSLIPIHNFTILFLAAYQHPSTSKAVSLRNLRDSLYCLPPHDSIATLYMALCERIYLQPNVMLVFASFSHIGYNTIDTKVSEFDFVVSKFLLISNNKILHVRHVCVTCYGSRKHIYSFSNGESKMGKMKS